MLSQIQFNFEFSLNLAQRCFQLKKPANSNQGYLVVVGGSSINLSLVVPDRVLPSRIIILTFSLSSDHVVSWHLHGE